MELTESGILLSNEPLLSISGLDIPTAPITPSVSTTLTTSTAAIASLPELDTEPPQPPTNAENQKYLVHFMPNVFKALCTAH